MNIIRYLAPLNTTMPYPLTPISIVIVDDHSLFCDGLKLLLHKAPDKEFEVTGIAKNGWELIDNLKERTPDIILMDVQMPGMDGIQATSYVTQNYPSIPVLAISTFDNLWAVTDMVAAGAKGYVLKNVEKEELYVAIRQVFNGANYYAEAILKHINPEPISKRMVETIDPLSEREKEVVRLLCQGKTSKEIAHALFISRRTVDGHRDKILTKINGNHAIDIVMYAVKNGIHKI